ncbi:AI-2E family transporter [Tuberibacillus calidus]|uniref:AI-2E family transporter n=1 Tax=Tuberibacillus calidus TaxID=340097 RepID=UPI0004892D97|nr:AI-2E family transporter [Tuberibacillus calidus]
MFKSKLHFWTVEILMIVIILFVCTKLSFIFEPLFTFISTLFFPFLISIFLYFLLNPIVNLIEKAKIPRTLAILILYVIFVGAIVLVIGLIGPVVVRQINQLINNIPEYVKSSKDLFNYLMHTDLYNWVQEQKLLEKVNSSMLKWLTDFTDNITAGMQTAIGVITSITVTIITVPFILFYMFKDGKKFPLAVMRFIPVNYRNEGLNIIRETGETLGTYIQGQTLVCLAVGFLTFIGFLIIHLPYALLLGLIIAVTNIIPYLGPFIGAAPAVIVGLLDTPSKALLAVIVVVVVQQIDGNIMSPLIIGKRLDMHPLTIIVLLLVAGNLAGVLGMILAVPVYAVAKTVVINIYRLWQLRKAAKHD